VSTASEDRDRPSAAPRAPGEGDFEEVLRRALRSALDGIEPAGDGLTQIFRRAATPWLVRQVSLLATDCVDLLRLITIWLQPMFARVMSVLAAAGGSVHEALGRLTSQAPAAAPSSSGQHCRRQARAAVFWGRSPALKARARAAVAWLRPALPVAVTAAVVMTGTVALSQTVARIEGSSFAPTGAASVTGDHRQSPHGELNGPGPAQITPAWPGTTPAGGGGATHQHFCAATRCPPSPAGAPPSGPATGPSAQPTTSPSPTPAPTPTPAPSHHHHHPHQPHPHPSHPPYLSHPGPARTPGQ
jgi:hypothetical protein